jgi:flagellar basal-body rod protein FlgF/flagellar basal-body rod protein FlgG
MPYGMYLSAAGAHVQSQRLQVLSNNIANANTPGFKREFAVFQARNAEAIEQGTVMPGTGMQDDVGGGVNFQETVTDFSGGTLQQTGNPTDLAIQGDGFFLVANEGQQFLTRAGNFHFAPTGHLLTEQGHQVLSSDRQPIVINPSLPWEFLAHGTLRQSGAQFPLAVVQPESLSDLQKAGQTLFSLNGSIQDVPGSERQVASGFLEQSSVQPAIEMMELIETSRAYEANVRLIQNQDQLLGTLINRVLRV